jgi:diaminopimelate decarboxylase
MQETGLVIRSLHIHTGSEIKDVAVFCQGMELLFGLVRHFPDLKVLDLGGGFKVPYKPGETGTDIPLLASAIARSKNAFEAESGRHLQLWFEPGKFMVSECGHFIVQVSVLKTSGKITFAGVDSGFNHLIRPMLYGAYHAIHNISRPGGEKKNYHVVGNICETDTFAEGRDIPEIREGDLLAIRNAGAYCFEMASSYNSRCRPAEVLVKNGQARLIRRRETLDDLLRAQLEI